MQKRGVKGRGAGGGVEGGKQAVLWEMCKWRMSVFQRGHK